MKPHQRAAWFAAAALVASLVVGIVGFGKHVPKDGTCGTWPGIKIAEAFILICWAVLPPIWFWYEYFFVYKPPKKDEAPRTDFESFKYGQDVSSKIWIAVVSALLILYFGKDIRS
jgi:hypothetical protein